MMKLVRIVPLFIILITSFIYSGCNKDETLSPQQQLEKDVNIIRTYLNDNGINAVEDESGLFYVIHQQGTGTSPVLSNKVKVNYSGNILGSTQVFDSGQAVIFPLGQLIEGWQIGFPLLQEGGSATLYIPSGLGYGTRGAGSTILANANLVFEVDLLEVL